MQLIALEDIAQPWLPRQTVREGLGECDFKAKVDGRTRYLWHADAVLDFLNSDFVAQHKAAWELAGEPWREFARTAPFTIDTGAILDREIVKLRQATRRVRKDGTLADWLRAAARHEVTNYDQIRRSVPSEGVPHIRPILHARIAEATSKVLPSPDELVTAFQGVGDSEEWRHVPARKALLTFAGWKAP